MLVRDDNDGSMRFCDIWAWIAQLEKKTRRVVVNISFLVNASDVNKVFLRPLFDGLLSKITFLYLFIYFFLSELSFIVRCLLIGKFLNVSNNALAVMFIN